MLKILGLFLISFFDTFPDCDLSTKSSDKLATESPSIEKEKNELYNLPAGSILLRDETAARIHRIEHALGLSHDLSSVPSTLKRRPC